MKSTKYISDAKVLDMLSRFLAYVQHIDGQSRTISFRDSSGVLGREEDYKSRIAEEARRELDCKNWNDSWVGTGKIAYCARRAMNKAGNLVNKNQQVDFKNRLEPTHPNYCPEAERVLYDVFLGAQHEESVTFANAVKTFGAKYDTLAFLYFVKDDTRFLPISPGHFDNGFSLLGIDYSTSYKCSWENYQGFISIIKEIRTVMEEYLPVRGVIRLIDAHSFVWIVQQDKFASWKPEEEEERLIEHRTEECLQAVISGKRDRRSITANVFARSAEVVKATKKRAGGICQYCGKPAPFTDQKGEPYLEVHHIEWLSRGGEDSTSNTVALCPNCHSRMHILDDENDIKVLKQAITAK